jgi:acetyl-CoA acetyltransferase
MLPNARIPYGTWGSSYFPAWQSSALAEVNIGQFAGESMARIMGLRKVPMTSVDALVIGSTVPWHWKFFNGPLVAACAGRRIPGYHVEQACATGLQAVLLAGAEVEAGHDTVGVLTFDRTSDSPVGVFPERRAHDRTMHLNDVWQNFGFDPATGNSMLVTAGNAARKYKLDRQEVDDLIYLRYEQYFEARDSGFLDRVLVPLDVLDMRGKLLGRVDSDKGVQPVDRTALAGQREIDTCVTSGGQTHPSDGMATLLVAHKDRLGELSQRPEIDISFVGKTEMRTQPSMMPEAPALAVGKLLERTGLSMTDMAVVKDHNPFAVNDAIFARVHDYDWREMNKTGCSLVWGHPQGPTLTRTLIEGLEEAVDLGGGHVLVFGCAAGDIGIAAIFKVSDGGRS